MLKGNFARARALGAWTWAMLSVFVRLRFGREAALGGPVPIRWIGTSNIGAMEKRNIARLRAANALSQTTLPLSELRAGHATIPTVDWRSAWATLGRTHAFLPTSQPVTNGTTQTRADAGGVRAILVDSGRCRAKFGRDKVGCDRIRAECWPMSSQCLPKLADLEAILAEIRSDLAECKLLFGRFRAAFGRLAEFGPHRTKSC